MNLDFRGEQKLENFESVFDSNFLQMTRESLATDLEAKLSQLKKEGQKETNGDKKLEITIRRFSVATIMVECYLMDPLILIRATKELAEEYRDQGYLVQSYHHSVEALNRSKVHQHIFRNDDLLNELYVNLCESCFANKSFREGLYYVQEFLKRKNSSPNTKHKPQSDSADQRMQFINAKILYKIGEFKEAETLFQKCLAHFDRKRKEKDQDDQQSHGPSEENPLQDFLSQTEALDYLQKIARKEGKFSLSRDFIRDLLKCCADAEKKLFQKGEIFRLRLKFSLLLLSNFEKSNNPISFLQKTTPKLANPSPEYLRFLGKFLTHLNSCLEQDLSLLDTVKDNSTLPKLMKTLENLVVFFEGEANFGEMLRIASIVTHILKYVDDRPSLRNCCYFLLNQMLRVDQEKAWSEEWKTQVKSELRGIQKMARILKNSFLKEVSKSLFNEIDSLRETLSAETVTAQLVEYCRRNISGVVERIRNSDFE